MNSAFHRAAVAEQSRARHPAAVFPGISLAALPFVHQRHVLFDGHEPLDTDTTKTEVADD